MTSRQCSAIQIVRRSQNAEHCGDKCPGDRGDSNNAEIASSHEETYKSEKPSSKRRCTREKKMLSGKRKMSKHDKSKGECEMCGGVFLPGKSLDSHMSLAHKGWNLPLDSLAVSAPAGSETFSCQACNNAYRCRSALSLHSKTHARYPYTCNFCGTGVSKLVTLQKHRMEHSQVFKCNCGKTFSCKKSLQRHKKDWCASPKRKRRMFYCPVCNELFPTVNLRKRHIEEKHLGFTTCKVCGMNFPSAEKHSKHVCTDSSSDLKYFCDSCPKRFISYSKLMSHMQQTHQQCEGKSEKDIPMADIGSEAALNSKSKDDLFTEFFVSVKKDGKKKSKYNSLCEIKCDFCPKIFTCRYAFQNHQLFHARDKSLTCKYCGKTLSHKGSLMSHLRIHQGDRPFICEMCGKKFVEKSQLTRHVRIHTGERPYVCDKCGQTFNQPSSLKTHLRTHDQHGTMGGRPPQRGTRASRSSRPVQQKKRAEGSTVKEAGHQGQETRLETTSSVLSATQPHDPQNSYSSQKEQYVKQEPVATVADPAFLTPSMVQTTTVAPCLMSPAGAPTLMTLSSISPASALATMTHLVPVAPPESSLVTVPDLMTKTMTATVNPAMMTPRMSTTMTSTLAVPTMSTTMTSSSVSVMASPRYVSTTRPSLLSALISGAMMNSAPVPPAASATPVTPSTATPAMLSTLTDLSTVDPTTSGIITNPSAMATAMPGLVTDPSAVATEMLTAVSSPTQVAPGISRTIVTSNPFLASVPHSSISSGAPAVNASQMSFVVTLPHDLRHTVLQTAAPPVSQMVSDVVLETMLQLEHFDPQHLAGIVGHSVSQRLTHQMAALASEELPRLMVEFLHYIIPLVDQQSFHNSPHS